MNFFRGALKKMGFSIIEAVLGIVLISSCFLSLVNVLSDSTLANIKIDFLTSAVLLARGEMSRVLSKNFDNIVTVGSQNFGGDFSNYNYTITVDYVDPLDPNISVQGPTDLKKITVVVSAVGRPDMVYMQDLKVKIQ